MWAVDRSALGKQSNKREVVVVVVGVKVVGKEEVDLRMLRSAVCSSSHSARRQTGRRVDSM